MVSACSWSDVRLAITAVFSALTLLLCRAWMSVVDMAVICALDSAAAWLVDSAAAWDDVSAAISLLLSSAISAVPSARNCAVDSDANCALVRDASAHRATFAVSPEYLQSAPRGLASGEWLHEWGLQTSRGFRALKIWMALKEQGVAQIFGPGSSLKGISAWLEAELDQREDS